MKKWFNKLLVQFLGRLAYELDKASRRVYDIKEYIRNGQLKKRYNPNTAKERAIKAFMNTPGTNFPSTYAHTYCEHTSEIGAFLFQANQSYYRFHDFNRHILIHAQYMKQGDNTSKVK